MTDAFHAHSGPFHAHSGLGLACDVCAGPCTVDYPRQSPVARITAEPSSRLEVLAAEYAIAKPAADAAETRLTAVVDAIKVALAEAAPGATTVYFDTPVLEKPLKMQAISTWRLDTKKLKENDPATYARYAAPRTYWELRADRGKS